MESYMGNLPTIEEAYEGYTRDDLLTEMSWHMQDKAMWHGKLKDSETVVTTLRAELAAARAKAVELAGAVENSPSQYTNSQGWDLCSFCGSTLTDGNCGQCNAIQTAADVLKEWG
jgi:hypothetical protein